MSYKLLFGLNAQPEIQILNTPYVHKYQKMYVIVCIQKNLLCRQESRVVCPLDLLYMYWQNEDYLALCGVQSGSCGMAKKFYHREQAPHRAGTSQSRRVRSFDMTAFDRANWPPEGSKCQATPL